MKILRLLAAIIAVSALSCTTIPSNAQPTHEVGSTTLTEYDLVTGLQVPWEILWGPDDHIWATLRTGKVLRIDPATGNYTEVLSLDVMASGQSEPGLLGMAMHPDWENNPKVFVVYCQGSIWNGGTEYLSVFDWNGTELVNELVIFDEVAAESIHDGSRLLITDDNKILMTTGDAGDGGQSSQNINSNNGKVLRLNLDGSIPDDNPIAGSPVYSWGHRNAQGLCHGPNGLIYSSEHGQSNHDEFNIIEPNRNYGWPEVEGICDQASEADFCTEENVREPLEEWSPCIAVNGIEYYDHPAIPEWQNSVLMSVLGGLGGAYERLSVLHMSEDGMAVESEDQYFAEFNQRIRDVCINPYTGAVYVAFNGPSYPGSGPNTIKEFVNEAFTNVTERDRDQFMSIFPNPMEDSATIEVSESLIGSTLLIHDAQGKLVSEAQVNSMKFVFNRADLKAGQYYVKVSSTNGTLSKSLIIR